MFDILKRWARSWIAGLANATLDVMDAVRPPLAFRVKHNTDSGWVMIVNAPPSRFRPKPLEHRAENRNRHNALDFCFRIGSFLKPVPPFRSDAISLNTLLSSRNHALPPAPVTEMAETHLSKWKLQPIFGKWMRKQTPGARQDEQSECARAPETAIAAAEFMHLIKDADIVIELPSDWSLRRALDPVPKKTAAYIDAFVRHHIERVTPWRVDRTYYVTETGAITGDAEKMSVDITVVARDLVEPIVVPLAAARPRRITLVIEPTEATGAINVTVPLATGGEVRRRKAEAAIGIMVGLFVLTMVALTSAASWYQSSLQNQLDELDQDIAAKQAFVTAAVAKQGKSQTAPSGPRSIREATIPVVSLIETLSTVLPRDAYLTDLTIDADQIRISGVSHGDVAGLIPVIERSGSFTEVSFFAPTTRSTNESADRFYIEMRIRALGNMGTTFMSTR